MTSPIPIIEKIDDYISISLLQSYDYCKRRCSLQLMDNPNMSNIYTVEGSIQHKKVHNSHIEKSPGLCKVFNLQIFSNKYKLLGRGDLIEFTEDANGPYVDILDGHYNIVPVEYKHGEIRRAHDYEVQLCAQAMCLEEMYDTTIEKGYIYYVNSDERVEVLFKSQLRGSVLSCLIGICEIITNGKLYPPEIKKSCSKCSLYDICLPKSTNIKKYLIDLWRNLE